MWTAHQLWSLQLFLLMCSFTVAQSPTEAAPNLQTKHFKTEMQTIRCSLENIEDNMDSVSAIQLQSSDSAEPPFLAKATSANPVAQGCTGNHFCTKFAVRGFFNAAGTKSPFVEIFALRSPHFDLKSHLYKCLVFHTTGEAPTELHARVTSDSADVFECIAEKNANVDLSVSTEVQDGSAVSFKPPKETNGHFEIFDQSVSSIPVLYFLSKQSYSGTRFVDDQDSVAQDDFDLKGSGYSRLVIAIPKTLNRTRCDRVVCKMTSPNGMFSPKSKTFTDECHSDSQDSSRSDSFPTTIVIVIVVVVLVVVILVSAVVALVIRHRNKGKRRHNLECPQDPKQCTDVGIGVVPLVGRGESSVLDIGLHDVRTVPEDTHLNQSPVTETEDVRL